LYHNKLILPFCVLFSLVYTTEYAEDKPLSKNAPQYPGILSNEASFSEESIED